MMGKLNLDMLRNLWKCDAGKICHLGIKNPIDDHLLKKNYSKMYVHLAVQVLSNSMVRLRKDYADKCGGKESYTSLSTMVIKIDRHADILNNTYVSNRDEKKDCKIIDCPDHLHI